MERKRGTTIVVVATLIIAIVSLGIAFAAFSTTLTINGGATVQATSWNIHYATTNNGTDPGTGTGASITPTTTGTATGSGTLKTADFTWDATFKTPGDKVVYTFFIRNAGTYNAKISSINTPTLTCEMGGSPETTVCGKMSYDVYKDAAGTTKLTTSDTLAAGSSMQVYVIASLANTFAANGSDLPTSNVTVNPTTISIQWQQN